MSAIAPAGGQIRQLDAPSQPDTQVTTTDVADPPTLARIIQRALNDIAKLKRRWAPDFIDFRDIFVDGTGTTKYRLPHKFGTAVNYWTVKWVGLGTVAPSLSFDATSDADTLVLVSNFPGIVTIRVERAG